MRTLKFPVFFLLCGCVLVTGCVSQQQYQDLLSRNARQSGRIDTLSSELEAAHLEGTQLKKQLDDIKASGGIEEQTLRDKVSALRKDLQRKIELINRMKQQLPTGATLPVELSTMLEDFAGQQDMVTYDASRGIVKFKSDLLFEKGSDLVKNDAAEAVKLLCGILKSEQGKNFDVIVAGHTDDIPIRKSTTRAKHPTNWHLSAHRAISVLDVMIGSGVDPKRMSVRGFGEYRPVAPNQPGKKGNKINRRVEIYIVPQGT